MQLYVLLLATWLWCTVDVLKLAFSGTFRTIQVWRLFFALLHMHVDLCGTSWDASTHGDRRCAFMIVIDSAQQALWHGNGNAASLSHLRARALCGSYISPLAIYCTVMIISSHFGRQQQETT